MRVLVVNAGSSSLKLSVLDGERSVAAHTVERLGRRGRPRPAARVPVGRGCRRADLDAVGHRVVHGGAAVHASRSGSTTTSWTTSTRSPTWRRCTTRARSPAIRRRRRAAARTCPRWRASTPRSTRRIPDGRGAPTPCRGSGTTRFGAAPLRLPRPLPRLRRTPGGRAASAGAPAGLRIVSCHLGAGASLCAVRGRPVGRHHDGVHAAGRAGHADPGRVGRPRASLLWLLEHGGVDVETLGGVLEHQSGLKGLSGTSGDLRDVLAARARR